MPLHEPDLIFLSFILSDHLQSPLSFVSADSRRKFDDNSLCNQLFPPRITLEPFLSPTK